MPDALTLSVTELSVHTPLTRRLRLALGEAPFLYHAGQGVSLGLHGQPERRPYSIAAAPEDARATGELEFLLRADAAGQVGRHLDGLHVGARVDLEGPFGGFTLPDPLPDVPLVFLAGGTGIAPLRAMMRAARVAGHAAPKHLVYSVRTPDDVAYAEEWEDWGASALGSVRVVVTRPEGRSPGTSRYRLDVHAIAPLLETAPHAYCFLCGPPTFVDDLVHLLSHLGVRSDHIRHEGW